MTNIQDGQSRVQKSVATPKSLEGLRPLPKAGPRKSSTNGRKQGKCEVLTDTPETKALETGPETKALEAEIAAKLKNTESKKNALKLKHVHKAKKILFGQAKKNKEILNPSGKNKATK